MSRLVTAPKWAGFGAGKGRSKVFEKLVNRVIQKGIEGIGLLEKATLF